ncbi:MAG: DUF1475 domain-containing protein [Acidobacteria bacterium]|nr:DUF1475 domain-containing protein [Acidobacteriota bacterium]
MGTLKIVSWAILLGMVGLTVVAITEQGLFEAGAQLWPDAWFRATLADAYFGFLIAYCWIVYKEASPVRRALWFVAVMSLGTIAVSTYLLIQLYRLPPESSVEALLLRARTAR